MRRAGKANAARVAAAALLSMALAACQPGGGSAATGDGKAASGPAPDLTGIWGPATLQFGNNQIDGKGNVDLGIGSLARQGRLTNFERDSGILQRAHANRPWYKPQHWARVQHLDINGNQEDPTFRCLPAGVPRLGAPVKITQTAAETLFFYNRYEGGNAFRIIYTDGREHPSEDKWLSTWHGHSIGRWEGDTFVVDTVDLTDESWLEWPGYFHTTETRVVERLRMVGDELHYQATVHDPEILMRSWERDTVILKRNADPKAELVEELPCNERDREGIVTRERG